MTEPTADENDANYPHTSTCDGCAEGPKPVRLIDDDSQAWSCRDCDAIEAAGIAAAGRAAVDAYHAARARAALVREQTEVDEGEKVCSACGGSCGSTCASDTTDGGPTAEQNAAWQFNEAVSLLREARGHLVTGTSLADEIDDGLPAIDEALRGLAALVREQTEENGRG